MVALAQDLVTAHWVFVVKGSSVLSFTHMILILSLGCLCELLVVISGGQIILSLIIGCRLGSNQCVYWFLISSRIELLKFITTISSVFDRVLIYV